MRDLRGLSRFYDVLMPALGLTKVRKGDRFREYFHQDRREPFFGLVQAVTSKPSLSRTAFAAATRKDVDRIAAVVKRAGGKKLCGPEVCTSYHQPYYAFFFEDPEGNKFEVCCRR